MNYSFLRQSGKTAMMTKQLERYLNMQTKITLSQLKEVLISYDKTFGSFPKNKYEGHSIYNFTEGLLSPFSKDVNGITLEEWEESLEN